MGDRLTISLMLDFYGPLLTPRQRTCLQLHHEEDLSLGEIASLQGVSRQAVHDNMQRALQLMAGYEEKLQLVAQYRERQDKMDKLRQLLEDRGLLSQDIREVLDEMEG